jgi:CoA:oxalate CoA-transferase
MAAATPKQPPLTGCVVLDLSQFLAGPYCTQILADLGAEVIKIEPVAGDMTRGLPPYFVNETSAYFLSFNRNKKSIVIDLKHPTGRGLFLDLVARADMVVENFRSGVMERLGLGREILTKVNPAIVVCSISGFGKDGPYEGRPAYDLIVQALAGVMSLTGEPGGIPVRTGVPVGDLAAGMFGAIGALAALANARVTGEGSHVDVSMLDGQISLLSYLAVYYLVSGEVPGAQGRDHMSIPTYRAFRCADGLELVVTANTEAMWRRMCDVVERPELAADARFMTNRDRFQHRRELDELLEPAFLQRPSEVWISRLNDAGIPAGRINSVDRALADPQVLHRNMVVTTDAGNGREVRLLGNPVKYSDRAEEPPRWPPGLGQHTSEVLTGLLGLPAPRVAELAEAGIVTCGPAA